MTTICAIKATDQLNPLLFDRLLAQLPAERQTRINRFLQWEDAQRSLVGDILSRYLLCHELKIKNHQLSISFNPYGKPMLKNCNNVHFNVSHSGHWIICGISSNQIGVDVQHIRPIDLNIAQRYFTQQEYEHLIKQKKEHQLAFFYDLWTLKESYIKAIGRGLSLPLDSFAFQIRNNAVYFSCEQATSSFSFQLYTIDDNYKLSGCVENGNLPESITIVDGTDLCKKFIEHYCKSST